MIAHRSALRASAGVQAWSAVRESGQFIWGNNRRRVTAFLPGTGPCSCSRCRWSSRTVAGTTTRRHGVGVTSSNCTRSRTISAGPNTFATPRRPVTRRASAWAGAPPRHGLRRHRRRALVSRCPSTGRSRARSCPWRGKARSRALPPRTRPDCPRFDALLEAVQEMLLRVAFQTARDNYKDRRERQRQGIEIAKRNGRYTGRKADQARHRRIVALRGAGMSIARTAELTPCSPAQVKWLMALHRGTSAARPTNANSEP